MTFRKIVIIVLVKAMLTTVTDKPPNGIAYHSKSLFLTLIIGPCGIYLGRSP